MRSTELSAEELLNAMLDDAMLVTRDTWATVMHPSNRLRDLTPLRQVHVPTLVVIGGRDTVISVKRQSHLATLLPNARQVVLECEGHGMVGEQPETVFQAIRHFLEQLPGPPM